MGTAAAKSKPKKPLGRRPIYGATMKERLMVRLTAEQSHAFAGWCRAHRCSLLSLLRTAALETAGIMPVGSTSSLRGKIRGSRVKGATSIGVPFPESELAQLRSFSARRKVDASTFIRESALHLVGARHLGAIGSDPALESAVTGARA